MKKVLIGITGIIALLILTATFGSGPIIKYAVEKIGPQVSGTTVVVEAVHVKLFAGMLNIQGFIVGNPEGFSAPSAIEIKRFSVKLKTDTLFSDTLIIEEIFIEGPQITYEVGMRGSNIGVIEQNIEAYSRRPAPETKPTEAPAQKKPGKKIIVNYLLVTDGKVSLNDKLLSGQSQTVTMPRIEMHDIGKKKGGTSLVEITTEILTRVMSVVVELSGTPVDDALEIGKKALKEVGNAAEELFKGVGRILK
jgi:hypothetical protein